MVFNTHLINRGINKQKIRNLLDFIKYYIRFEQKEFLNKFEQELQSIIKSRQAMGIREAILHDVKQSGFEEGQAAGIEKMVKRAWRKGLTMEAIAELADISLEKATDIIQELMAGQGEADQTTVQPASISNPTGTLEIDDKKRSAILHAWEKGLPLEEITELTGLTMKTVDLIIRKK